MNPLRETVQVRTVGGKQLNPCKLGHALKLQERGRGLIIDGVFVQGARKPARLTISRVVFEAIAHRPGYSVPCHFTFARYPIPDLCTVVDAGPKGKG